MPSSYAASPSEIPCLRQSARLRSRFIPAQNLENLVFRRPLRFITPSFDLGADSNQMEETQ